MKSTSPINYLVIEKTDKISVLFRKALSQYSSQDIHIQRCRLSDLERGKLELKDIWGVIIEADEGLLGEVQKQISFNSFQLPVIIVADELETNPEKTAMVKSFSQKLPYLQAIIDLSHSLELYAPVLKNFLGLHSFGGDFSQKEDLEQLNRKLDQQIEAGLEEVDRLEKIQKRIAPKRQEKVKGVSFMGQYSPGISSGGEYFDLFKTPSTLIFFASSCRSYIVSGIVMGALGDHNPLDFTGPGAFEEFLRDLKGRLEECGKASGERAIDLFVGRLHLFDFKFDGHCFGPFVLGSSSGHLMVGKDIPLEHSFLSQSTFSLNLKRSEKLIVLSPGLMEDLKGQFQGKELIRSFDQILRRDENGILNDVFFELENWKEDGYLQRDACAIVIRVDENAIFKV